VLQVEQVSGRTKERNDRLFVVPERSPFEGDLIDIRRLPKRAIGELEKFFQATDALEAKELRFLGWQGPRTAIKAIKKASRQKMCV
jgi:inorganic pyrophosphatase